jgi:hypothetical protein
MSYKINQSVKCVKIEKIKRFSRELYRRLQCSSGTRGCVSCVLPSSTSSFLGAINVAACFGQVASSLLGAINAAACVGQNVLYASSFLGATRSLSLLHAKAKIVVAFSWLQKQRCCYISLCRSLLALFLSQIKTNGGVHTNIECT